MLTPDPPPVNDRPRTTTSRSSARGSLLAPVVVGLAGLAVGGALVAVLADDGEASVRSEAAPTSEAPDVETTAPASTVDPAPSTTVADAPLRDSAARIDGVVYLETAQCIAFPISNPEAGVGDAHVNVSLHRVESTDGRRVIVERWSEDSFTSVGLVEPGARIGRSESESAGPPSGDPVLASVAMDDGSTVEVEHTLTTNGLSCASTLVTGDDEFAFRSLGMIDVCSASEASGLGSIATFQSGSMMRFGGDGEPGSITGTLRHVDDDTREVMVGAVTGTESFDTGLGATITGTLTPSITGAAGGDDAITSTIDTSAASPSCLPAQEAAFTD